MGRKIPGRKHKGVRDPEKQREIRLQKLKGKIDAPPIDPDHQEVPHSLNRLIELKEIAKNSKRKSRKSNANKFLLEREKGESQLDYLHRVDAYCDDIIQENALENKHSVDVKEMFILVKPFERLTKSQKRQKKLAEKKEKKTLEKQLDDYVVKDHVKFGEVVHAPPTLSIPRKGFKSDGAARPGQKNLLLKSMFGNNVNEPKKLLTDNQKQNNRLKQISHKVIDKKGKRKHLPNALRRKMEDQQQEIIKAYRKIKEQKLLKK
ncbi:hypothetical protein FQR65_LT03287 [Abscondita terminalis]|nr:hypothetical protein FQR65_LT03287 [Abscondita terminalis]